MIGIDTNVLLRLFLHDDAAQTMRARKCVAEAGAAEPIVVNPIVLAEFVWTLSRGWKQSRKQVAGHLATILAADDLRVLHRREAQAALVSYRRGKADFADYFLAEINADAGCRSTLTFDRDALDSKLFSEVP
jgi:predicted nucleic-acid-binding protein